MTNAGEYNRRASSTTARVRTSRAAAQAAPSESEIHQRGFCGNRFLLIGRRRHQIERPTQSSGGSFVAGDDNRGDLIGKLLRRGATLALASDKQIKEVSPTPLIAVAAALGDKLSNQSYPTLPKAPPK